MKATTKPAQFTPGPWELSSTHRDEQYIDEPLAEELRPLFRIHWDNNVSDTEAEQGATLIAAAPAMYEALQQSLVLVELAALEEWGREVTGEQQPPTTEARDRLEKVKAALAQAEGRHHE